ncbi:MAG: MgtC/SapB family protein [Deltaproteobacteria bacterium]|nr:MgtC/SapB family protein [Deltaproteobacteria bacterium]
MEELAGLLDRYGSSFAVQIVVAVLCGSLIGIERQLRGKAIGIRTSVLICLATEEFVRLGLVLGNSGADPTRVLGQVVTGVGFLGAGVIVARGGSVTGVTSAAVVWMLAAIGSTIGAGRSADALVLSLVTVGVLIGIRLLEKAFKRLRGSYDEPQDTNSP